VVGAFGVRTGSWSLRLAASASAVASFWLLESEMRTNSIAAVIKIDFMGLVGCVNEIIRE
jgi:hypothetical protein